MDLENTGGSPMISTKEISAETREKDSGTIDGLKEDSIEVSGKVTG